MFKALELKQNELKAAVEGKKASGEIWKRPEERIDY